MERAMQPRPRPAATNAEMRQPPIAGLLTTVASLLPAGPLNTADSMAQAKALPWPAVGVPPSVGPRTGELV